MTSEQIISALPYQYPFLFVDEIIEVDTDRIIGSYTYDPELPFYLGHFKNNPITPGVILTETMAQIGLVSLGIYMLDANDQSIKDYQIAMTSSEIQYYIPVLPSETVIVKSEKDYFRFQKLKCRVTMYNQKEELVCRGTISGMITTTK
jgi:3-hydroxyacyl-[acyl-carrier-protein] dehydratase